MRMDFTLNLTQEQKLIMTQQMQLSVKLLQMSNMELQSYVEKELQENPVLDQRNDMKREEDINNRVDYKELIKYLEFDNYGHGSYVKNEDEEISPFNFIAEEKSLKGYLLEQLSELNIKDNLEKVCEYIIENIDERGYLGTTTEIISKDLKYNKHIIEEGLKIVQGFDPCGVASRDLKECLTIQAKKRDIKDKNLYIIINDHLEDLADNKYLQIAKELNITPKEAQKYGDLIKSFEPKPSRGFFTGENTKYVVPDAYIRKIDDEFFIVMNDDALPRLMINPIYKDIIQGEQDKEAVNYIKDKLSSAMFLMKSIQNRKSTIYKVLEKILELQRDYFEYGEEYLKPMTLREVADSINMHESTVSRAIREKYIYTGKSTVKIKDLFTKGVSSKESYEDISTNIIKNKIKELIDKENKKKPLSDQIICDIINKEGMNISRRTVAKYRENMGIKSSSKRKRF